MDPGAGLGEGGQLPLQAAAQGVVMIVVTRPVFVKITQYVECFRIPGGACEISLEDRGQRGAVNRKMQIGNEMNLHARCAPVTLSNDLGALDDHVFLRHILMETAAAGLDTLDLVDHIHAFADLAEYAVTPALDVGGAVI